MLKVKLHIEENFKMDECRNSAIGFCLLPCELIQSILLYLSLPEIIHMKLVNKSIFYIISDHNFIRECNLRSKSATWLFVYKKRWRLDATLHGFSDQSDRWFKISVADLLKETISPGEDLYFLAACGNFFLFASNTHKVVIAVNLVSKTVKKIPPCPLGPRGTSSWRRSGMKVLAGPIGSGYFRFLFAELVENRPVLFEYNSRTDTWRSKEAEENVEDWTRVADRENAYVFLNVANEPYQSVMVAVGSQCDDAPVVLRPRYNGGGHGRHQLAVGFSWGHATDQLHVYGDGYIIIVRSGGVDDVNRRVSGIEVWSLSLNGRQWEYISKVPSDLTEQINKPYGVMMGCLEERDGIIRFVLMSNFEGSWDIVWLTYDIESGQWTWVPLPDCKMKGLNMAGITFSSGLTLT